MIDPNDTFSRKRRVSPLFILIIILIGWWFLFVYEKPVVHDQNAEPRAVIPRGDLASDEKNTIELFQAASPSVAYITSIEVRRSLFSLNVYEIPKGTGSGFIWDTDGRIVTNYHVIEDASRVDVTLADHSSWKGTVVGVAPDKDLAVLKISAPASQLKALPIGESHNLMVGQKVFAIGNPFGLDQTLTSGIVSALGREIKAITGRTIQDVIQTDAAINPGNSGGPLLDSSGRLIGVNTAIYSPSGGSAGIGFAVPVDVVNRVVPEIIKYGRVIRPGLGITVANDKITHRFGIDGVLIINIMPKSTAENAGLQGTQQVGNDIIFGDIITAIDQQKISNTEDLRNILDRYRVGDEVNLTVLRDNQQVNIKVILEEVG